LEYLGEVTVAPVTSTVRDIPSELFLPLELDRAFGFQFFNPDMGGSSLLWQHLFWWFGHPEVYIIFLPATGVISTIIPVFARRRIVVYPFIIAALLITGFVSFGLWTIYVYILSSGRRVISLCRSSVPLFRFSLYWRPQVWH
jgi:heme/copper-type cytochrome/quinol oxidase subunit 1